MMFVDLCGHYLLETIRTLQLSLMIDYSRFAWVYPLKAKFEVFMCFKLYVLMVENISSCAMGTLHFDRGTEYMSKEFYAFWRLVG